MRSHRQTAVAGNRAGTSRESISRLAASLTRLFALALILSISASGRTHSASDHLLDDALKSKCETINAHLKSNKATIEVTDEQDRQAI
jgi:hypothetical protein